MSQTPVAGHAEAGWLRRLSASRGLLAGPAFAQPRPLPRGAPLAVEWTQRRRSAGAPPPMVRVALLVAGARGESEQWFASAVGEGRVYAHGASLEYFGCGE